jgi:hypothetical protein
MQHDAIPRGFEPANKISSSKHMIWTYKCTGTIIIKMIMSKETNIKYRETLLMDVLSSVDVTPTHAKIQIIGLALHLVSAMRLKGI